MRFLCDVNVWLAMTLAGHRHHPIASAWFDAIDDRADVAFCRVTQQSYLRLLTTKAVLAPYGRDPLTNAEAWDVYDTLTTDTRVTIAAEPSGLERRWRRFAERPSASPKLWTDAYLAAFAVAGDRALVTTDRAFVQFDGCDVTILGHDG